MESFPLRSLLAALVCMSSEVQAAWLLDTAAREPLAVDGSTFVLAALPPHCPNSRWPAAERRIQAELMVLGLEVSAHVLVDSCAPPELVDLADAARAHNAVGALSMARHGDSGQVTLDLALLHPKDGRSLTRTRSLALDAAGDAAIAALQAVEMVLAGLVELDLRLVTASRSVSTATSQTAGRTVWVAGRGAALMSRGRFATNAAAGLAAGYRFHDHWELELDALVVVNPFELTSGDSSAHIRLAASRAWLRYSVELTPWLTPGLSMGVGAMMSWARGIRSQSRVLRDDVTVTAYGGARLHACLHVTTRLWLDAAVAAGFSAPLLRVRFGEQIVGRFGAPLVETTATMGFNL